MLLNAQQSNDAKPSPPSIEMRLGNTLYENLEFISTTGETVLFESSQGPVVAKWSDLPPNIRQRFGPDYEKALKEEQATVLQYIGPATISGKIIKKLSQGFLVNCGGETVLVSGMPENTKTAEGTPLTVTAIRAGLFQYSDGSGTRMIRKYRIQKPGTAK